jgi:anti-anti-sigma factor
MNVQSFVRGNKEVIQLTGYFDPADRRDFHRAINGVLRNLDTEEIEVDLGGVQYLDSAACGMLLMLRQKAQESGKTVALARAVGPVRQTLDIMNFKKLFPMR